MNDTTSSPAGPMPASATAPEPALAVRGLELRRSAHVAAAGTGSNGDTPPLAATPLVGRVDLAVERGQEVCLVGPSGCG